MRVPIEGIGDIGIVDDLAPSELPPNAWSAGRNVTFLDHKVQRGLGSQVIYDPPSVAPYWGQYNVDATRTPIFAYAGLQKVFCVSGGSHAEITRGAGLYTGGPSDRWSGGPFAGIGIFNNGIDVPQQWVPISSATLLADLSNWPATWRAKAVRPFKTFLIALGIQIAGTIFPHRIVFSQPADPGAVPDSWDPADPTKLVTSRDLVDKSGGGLVDGVALGEQFIAYKENSTHSCSFIGGAQVWRTLPIMETGGCLALGCAIAFDKDQQHFVMTGDDLVAHNGQSPQSLIYRKLRRWLQANISSTRYDRSFCYEDVQSNTCWFCFPSEGAEWPDTKLVWEKASGTVWVEDFDPTAFITAGLVTVSSGDAWTAAVGSWEDQAGSWDSFDSKAFLRQPLAMLPDAVQLRQMQLGNQRAGVDFSAFVERTDLDLMGIDRYGHLVRDQEKMKLVGPIWFQASGSPFQVQVGTKQTIGGAITWTAPKIFTPGVDRKVDFAESGVLWGLRISSTDANGWQIDRLAVEVTPLGDF